VVIDGYRATDREMPPNSENEVANSQPSGTRRLRWDPVVLVPVLLVSVPLIAIYTETAAHWTAVIRPMAIAMAAVFTVTVAAAGATRRPIATSVAVAILVLLVVELRMGVGFLLILVVAALVQRMRRRPLTIRPALLWTATALLVGATLFRMVFVGTVTVSDLLIAPATEQAAAASIGRPNVYVLLLDGYPRQDSLRDIGQDNEPFLRELEQLGFTINSAATTTFARTELTLSSLVGSDAANLGEYVYGQDHGTTELRRAVRRQQLVNQPVMDDLRALGYRMVYIPPPVTFAHWRGWDDTEEAGQPTDYEAAVIQRSALRYLLGGWVLDQARRQIDDTLAMWSRGAGQRFTFAHVMAPHPPFLWTEDGSVETPLPCWYALACSLFNGFPGNLGLSEDEFADKVGPQVAAVNERVVRATERIVRSDPDAVIVIFSDHGIRYRDLDDPEAFRSLFAARGTDARRADGLFEVLLDELRTSDP
jgi:hypothetical protein